MVPDGITSWGQVRPWLLRYTIRNAIPSFLAFLLFVISRPALTYGVKTMSAADLMVILGRNVIFHFSFRFLGDILLTSYVLYHGIKTNQRNQALEMENEETDKVVEKALEDLEKHAEQPRKDLDELVNASSD